MMWWNKKAPPRALLALPIFGPSGTTTMIRCQKCGYSHRPPECVIKTYVSTFSGSVLKSENIMTDDKQLSLDECLKKIFSLARDHMISADELRNSVLELYSKTKLDESKNEELETWGVFHVDGFRSQNYPWTWPSQDAAQKSVGLNIDPQNPFYKAHCERYVVKRIFENSKTQKLQAQIDKEYERAEGATARNKKLKEEYIAVIDERNSAVSQIAKLQNELSNTASVTQFNSMRANWLAADDRAKRLQKQLEAIREILSVGSSPDLFKNL